MNLIIQIDAGTPGVDLISAETCIKYLENIIQDFKSNGMITPGESLKLKDISENVIAVCELVQVNSN